MEVAARTLELGVSVVLDFGFWSRRSASSFEGGQPLARERMHALIVPLDELWARVERRNLALPPGVFHVTREQSKNGGPCSRRPRTMSLT